MITPDSELRTRNSIQSARTLHAFIVASTIIILAGALVVTRTTGSLVSAFGALDGVALMMGLSSLAITSLARQRLPSRPGGAGEEDWWRENLGRAVLIWALLEMPAVVGAITLIATRHLPVFAILGGLALASLVAARPARFGS